MIGAEFFKDLGFAIRDTDFPVLFNWGYLMSAMIYTGKIEVWQKLDSDSKALSLYTHITPTIRAFLVEAKGK